MCKHCKFCSVCFSSYREYIEHLRFRVNGVLNFTTCNNMRTP